MGLKFIQIDKVGKTIAKLEGCEYNVIHLLDNLVYKNCQYLNFNMSNKFILNRHYSAVAKVNTRDGDTYSEGIGIEISRNKVMNKYHASVDKKLRLFLTDLRSLEAGIEDYMDKHNVAYDTVPTASELKAVKFDANNLNK